MAEAVPGYRRLWALAWPILLANSTTPLVGLVDAALLGHLDDGLHLAAVGVASTLIAFLYWGFGFLRMGTTALVAQALGRDDTGSQTLVLLRALLLATLLALPVLALGPSLGALGLGWMGVATGIETLAQPYLALRLWSAPAVLWSYVLLGHAIGRQHTRLVLQVALTINLLNIGLDWLLIRHWQLASEGAALATVIAEWAGLLVALRTLRGIPRPSPEQRHTLWRDRQAWHALLQQNHHLFIRTLALLLVFAFFAAQGEALGWQVVAANALALQLLLLCSHALDGFAHSVESLLGAAWGRQERQPVLQLVRRAAVLIIATGALLSLLLAVSAAWLPARLTDLPAIQQELRQQWYWIALMPLLAAPAYLFDGIYIGARATRAMQNGMLLCVVGVFFPVWWSTQSSGNEGLWLAFTLFNIARGVSLAAWFPYPLRQLKPSSALR